MDNILHSERIRHGEREVELRLVPDADTEDPRSWDNLGVMLCAHKRYTLGDEQVPEDVDFHHWDDIRAWVKKERKGVCICDITMYDHSGLAFRLNEGFSDIDSYGWDWGQVGLIYTTRERMKMYLGAYRMTKTVREQVLSAFKNELQVYETWVNGGACAWEIHEVCTSCNEVEDTVIEACGGYYTWDDALKDGRIEAQGILQKTATDGNQKETNDAS